MKETEMIQKTKKAKKKVKTIGYRIELDLLVKVDEFAEKKTAFTATKCLTWP
jgi:hypothetical protein